MRRLSKRILSLTATLALVLGLLPAQGLYSQGEESSCITCHSKSSPVIVEQWKESKHAKMGIDCAACHVVKEGTPGSKKHFDGSFVSPIVTPKICGTCHQQAEKEFSASHHASAAKFIGSLDNVLGEVIEGGPAANLGCKQCHGSTIQVKEDGSLDHESWPNFGIGRINPDGSNGACSACHSRHTFSIAQAREPEVCGKCHMGPDHPQIEIYNESKHGILYRANKEKMNMSSKSWIPGKDYSAAPTCATCHMSASTDQQSTHDVGARISWTLRPPVSTKLPNADQRRDSMQGICRQCHSGGYVENFYKQYDSAVNLYNDKFGIPAKEIMDKLYAENLLTPTPFDEKIEWTYYMLWHHEGRRARHGAAMMGPDYVQWHGFFEVAYHFYMKFLPELKEIKPELVDGVLNMADHKWLKGLSKEDREGILQFYKERYGQ